MEDNRDQLAVILAGYEKEMESLIRSNPGLSSRVNTTIVFEDYSPTDLGKIFEVLCNQNQYELLGEARYLLLVGFSYLYQKRDRHFGNGRLARNTFEDSVRKLADRIARSSELTEALLTRLSAEDISIPGISNELLIKLADQAPLPLVLCTACKGRIRIQPRSLGCRIKCPKCEEIQVHPWASLAEDEAAC